MRMRIFTKEILIISSIVSICILSIILSISALVIANMNKSNNKEYFNPLGYPKAGDAFETGNYSTMGRECKPNLYKCKVNNQYFCSKHKDCYIPEDNVRGTLMKSPMSWFNRYV